MSVLDIAGITIKEEPGLFVYLLPLLFIIVVPMFCIWLIIRWIKKK